MTAHSVFVLEDHPATRAQLVNSVNEDVRLTVIGQAANLKSALAWFQSHKPPDAALIDLGLPDGNGESLIREIAHLPTLSLVITVFGDEKHVLGAIEAGAIGYLLKDRDPRQIADSICEVLSGGSPISPSIARLLLKRFQSPEKDDCDALLTPRETEVLNLVVKGFTYQEIASTLELSVHTITSHIQHIYKKLQVHTRGEAVFEALQLGLVKFKK